MQPMRIFGTSMLLMEIITHGQDARATIAFSARALRAPRSAAAYGYGGQVSAVRRVLAEPYRMALNRYPNKMKLTVSMPAKMASSFGLMTCFRMTNSGVLRPTTAMKKASTVPIAIPLA